MTVIIVDVEDSTTPLAEVEGNELELLFTVELAGTVYGGGTSSYRVLVTTTVVTPSVTVPKTVEG